MSKWMRSWIVLALVLIGWARGSECAFIKNLEAGQKQTLVVYGTSLTAGGAWVKLLQDRFNEKYPKLLTIVNAAQSGQHSTWGAQNVGARVVAKKPDAVLIEFGMNDAVTRFSISKETCRANVTTILDAIQKGNPQCDLIVMTMNCVAGENGAKRPLLPEYYQVYRDIATERKLLLIDHYVNWKAIQDKDAKAFDRLVPDGVHPTAAGAKDVILPEFEKVIFGKK